MKNYSKNRTSWYKLDLSANVYPTLQRKNFSSVYRICVTLKETIRPELLQKAVASIVEQKETSDLESLFFSGETTALVGDIAGLDDFELICLLVIK